MEGPSDNLNEFQNGVAGTVEPSAIEGANVALDTDTQTGLLLHPAERVKTSESPSDEDEEGESQSGLGGSEDEFDDENGSEDSFFLDLLHAEGAEYDLDMSITKEECEALRAELRELAAVKFMRKHLQEEPKYSLRELLYAFGYILPGGLDFPNETLAELLRMVVDNELRKRKKLEHVNTIDDVVNLIKSSQNILVLVGAGISTSCGIPDFRSDTGVYAMLADYGLEEPSDMFDIEVFRDNPKIFYNFAKMVLPSTTKYSPTHAFLRLLQDKDKLLRVYTQNIDNLERLAGVEEGKLVQCHGSFATASCMRCKLQVSGEEIKEDVLRGEIPTCPACQAEKEQKERQKGNGKKRKRSNDWDEDDEDEDDEIIEGIMKPDITFFGEALSKKFDYSLLGPPGSPETGDAHNCDLLICVGTSLKVAPVSEIIDVLPPNVPQIYISKTAVTHIDFDITLLGNCDDVIRALVRRCGFVLEHEKLEGGRSDVGDDVAWKEHQKGVYEIIET